MVPRPGMIPVSTKMASLAWFYEHRRAGKWWWKKLSCWSVTQPPVFFGIQQGMDSGESKVRTRKSELLGAMFCWILLLQIPNLTWYLLPVIDGQNVVKLYIYIYHLLWPSNLVSCQICLYFMGVLNEQTKRFLAPQRGDSWVRCRVPKLLVRQGWQPFHRRHSRRVDGHGRSSAVPEIGLICGWFAVDLFLITDVVLRFSWIVVDCLFCQWYLFMFCCSFGCMIKKCCRIQSATCVVGGFLCRRAQAVMSASRCSSAQLMVLKKQRIDGYWCGVSPLC